MSKLNESKRKKSKKVLIIYSRDVAQNDSGGARTTIQLANYISNKDGFECYCFFKILEGNAGKVKEVRDILLTVESLHKFIEKNEIDILLVPEAYKLSKLACDAVDGTRCKIISALHTKPGYEKLGFFTLLKESFLYNEKFIKRVRALLLIILYPISYYVYTRRIMHGIRKAYLRSDYVVLLSESFFKKFKSLYRLENDSKLIAIENALSFDYFATVDDFRNKKKQVLVVARLDERHKRISMVLKAWKIVFRQFPDWELLIVGSGRSQQSYINLATRLELERCRFLGHQKPETFYYQASVFLMTSAIEGWGMTLTEAQQFGCVPVVMDSFSAVHDIVNSGYNGVISPDKNIPRFALEVSKIIENDAYRINLAMNGVISSRRFTQDIVSEKWIALFNKVLSDRDL